SPDGAQVYVTGKSTGQGAVTIAYAAGTGGQLWVSHSKSVGLITGLAVSPDGTTVYETGRGRVSGKGSYIPVGAYEAAIGHRRWQRYSTKVRPANGELGAVAVSPDGSTVYVDGDAGALLPSSFSLILLAYQATGTLKWAARYSNRYTGGAYAGGAFGGRIVLGSAGKDLYVVGAVCSKDGHHVAPTFAFRAASGRRLWVAPDTARGGDGDDVITPDGRTVIAVSDRTSDRPGGYRIMSYNASTGATRWARRAPAAVPGQPLNSTA